LKQQNIIIITGLSGSGKSTAIKALEDVGFFCVDNLPVVLLPSFLELRVAPSSGFEKLALVMDIRQEGFVSSYAKVLDNLTKQGYQFKIVFLEATDNELLRRYSQTRRHHPLAGKESLLEGIRAERDQLQGLKGIADKVIDTSRYNVHELKHMVSRYVLKEVHTGDIELGVLSFGFKYGIPHDADLVMDVRFLPNPYFVPELRDLDGTSPQVEAFVKKWAETGLFLKKYLDLLDFLIPFYKKEGKSYLTIAVGCTGGRHRSIVVANEIFRFLKRATNRINLTHRDIELT
jgi:UPF0042 nucleotide-binding protein